MNTNAQATTTTMVTHSDEHRGEHAHLGMPVALFGQVVSIHPSGMAIVRLPDGNERYARIPQHVDPVWVASAAACAPLSASLLVHQNASDLALLAVYPGPEHLLVATPMHLRATHLSIDAPLGVDVRCGEHGIAILADGEVRIEGSEVNSVAVGNNIVRGATVRLN